MRRPEPAGSVLKALAPLTATLAELEGKALRGESLAVVELAALLSTSLTEAGRRATELVLDQAARAQAGPILCPCGKHAAPKAFETTHFIGRFGEVSVDRRRWVCECGRSFFPFDEAWRLPAGEYADDVREAAERLSVRLTFAEAVAELKYLWGVAPDASTAERWVRQDGARATAVVADTAAKSWAHYEAEVLAASCGDRPSPTREGGFGVVELDGVHALTWKPGQEPRRRPASGEAATVAPSAGPAGDTRECASAAALAPTISSATPVASVAGTGPASETGHRVDHHQPPSTLSVISGSPMGPTGRSPRIHGREICVGLVYLGEHACEESPGRGVLLERRYVATLDDRQGFWKALHETATVQGVLAREKIVRLTDGGEYFIAHSSELFCDQPLVEIIDCQHVKQHVWEAGHQLSTEKKEVDQWVLPRTEEIMNGKVAAVIGGLSGERSRQTTVPKIKAIDSLSGYLDRHKHMMDYPAYKAAGYPIATGAVESANGRLVGRCKQGGMIWSEPGLEAMVAMRVALMNPGAWQALWPHASAPDP
jgi:hypothetical protein